MVNTFSYRPFTRNHHTESLDNYANPTVISNRENAHSRASNGHDARTIEGRLNDQIDDNGQSCRLADSD